MNTLQICPSVRCSHFTLGNPKKSFFNIKRWTFFSDTVCRRLTWGPVRYKHAAVYRTEPSFASFLVSTFRCLKRPISVPDRDSSDAGNNLKENQKSACRNVEPLNQGPS